METAMGKVSVSIKKKEKGSHKEKRASTVSEKAINVTKGLIEDTVAKIDKQKEADQKCLIKALTRS
jgi:hypothetical protein